MKKTSIYPVNYPVYDGSDFLAFIEKRPRRILKTISLANETSAAFYFAKNSADTGLGGFIEEALNADYFYAESVKYFKCKLNDIFYEYQDAPSHENFQIISKCIFEFGYFLSKGQVVFHGGVWPKGCARKGDSFLIDRPFLTSFSPQRAATHVNRPDENEMMNAIREMKSYEFPERNNEYLWHITIIQDNRIPAVFWISVIIWKSMRL